MIRLVIFDTVGTVFDDALGVKFALERALSLAEVPWTRGSIDRVRGWAKPAAIRHILNEVSPEKLPLSQSIVESFRDQFIDHCLGSPRVKPMDGLGEILDYLRAAGIKVALCTPADEWILEAILTRLGHLADGFDYTCTENDFDPSNGSEALVADLMRRADIRDPLEVAVVGDSPIDLERGSVAGCAIVVGYTGGGYHTAEELAVHPHTHLIGSLNQLPSILQAA